MSRPKSNYLVLLQNNNKQKFSKEELEKLKEQQESNFTNEPIVKFQEVKDDPYANKQFNRILKLFKIIGRNDSLFTNSLNRLCIMYSEEKRLIKLRNSLEETVTEYAASPNKDWNTFQSLNAQLIQTEKLLNTRRNQILQLERCLGLTIDSAMRFTPTKQKENKDTDEDLFE